MVNGQLLLSSSEPARPAPPSQSHLHRASTYWPLSVNDGSNDQSSPAIFRNGFAAFGAFVKAPSEATSNSAVPSLSIVASTVGASRMIMFSLPKTGTQSGTLTPLSASFSVGKFKPIVVE